MQPLRLPCVSGCCRSSSHAKCIAAIGSAIGWSTFLCCVCITFLSQSQSQNHCFGWRISQRISQITFFDCRCHCHCHISGLNSIDTEKGSHYPASNSVSSFAKSEEIRPWLELLITLHPRIYIERVSPSSVRLRISKYIPLESRPRSIVLRTSEDSRDSIRTCS